MAESINQLNSSIDIRLPLSPETKDPIDFAQYSIIYNAIRLLQSGVDNFLDIPPNRQEEEYTLQVTDRGLSVDTSAAVIVPLEESSGFLYGTTIVITNISASNIAINAEEGVDLVTAGTTDIGNKELANFGVCTLRYLGGDTWIILGAGLEGV